MCSEAVLEKEGELYGDSGCGAEATPIDCAFTEAFNRLSPASTEASPRPMLWLKRSVRGQCANIAITATVAHSATRGLTHALSVFIDTGLPQPRNFSATLHQARWRL